MAKNRSEVVEDVTHEGLISNSTKALREDSVTDIELFDILTTHIVKLAPAETAVADAASTIEALAAKRAEEPEDEPADHD